MAIQVEFLASVRMYVQRHGRRYEVWVDPFSVAGEGKSAEEAVADAKRGLELHFTALAEALNEYGDKVELFCPLSAKLRRGRRKDFVVYSARQVGRRRASPSRAKELSASNLRRALRSAERIGLMPIPVGG